MMYPIITSNGNTYLDLGNNLLRPTQPTATVECPIKAAPAAVPRKKSTGPVPVRFPITRETWHLQCSQAKEGVGLTSKEDWHNPKTFSNENKNERERRSMERTKWKCFRTRRDWEQTRNKRTVH